MNVADYLERIGYSGGLKPTAETLRNIHRAHLFTVPFENLDIAWRREIRLNPDALTEKIVEQRRGGFCYELNGALASLLRALGFQVTLLSARVPREDGTLGPEFDHLALRIDLDEPWLADVGFGDCFVDPLRLQTGSEQEQRGEWFRIADQGNSLRLERKRRQEDWKLAYIFSLTPRRLEKFEAMCRYHQTSPESPFTRKRLCSRATDEGRVTLSEMNLVTTRHGDRDERLLLSDAEWRASLAEHFGVRAPLR